MIVGDATEHSIVDAPPTADTLGQLDVAVVHDYLNQRGGAERVVLELSDIWPDAPDLHLALPAGLHAAGV